MDYQYNILMKDGRIVKAKEVVTLWGLCRSMFFRGDDGGFYSKKPSSKEVIECGSKQVVGEIDTESLYKEFWSVPTDTEKDCMSNGWNRFKAGTPLGDIQQWLETEFGVSCS